jgi:transposase
MRYLPLSAISPAWRYNSARACAPSAAGRSSPRWRAGCASNAPGSPRTATGKAIDHSLKRWDALTRFLDEGRLCMSNNAAERELRAVAIGRKNWTFAGSDEGGRRAAAIYTLIATAKLNDVDPQAWLADVLARILDYPAKRISDLLPWNWHAKRRAAA